ncbi:branched-chain amino acid ABC transporter permease [Candidatus Micrarchaeota archaeon CG1_02_55_22]|nr:MAG: branched-chain amino acid ABC transporter permease [Candidatus Micrarchaeota archaeon CG1_02_55_22]
MIEAYLAHLLVLVCIYIVLAVSLQLSIGFTGLFNLGHIGFYAVGAYASALLALSGQPFWLCFLAAGVFAGLTGWLLSLPTGKLKGDYLALATLGFSFLVYAVALNWNDLTRGALGLPGIPKPELFGFAFSDTYSFLALAAVVAIASYLIVQRIASSPFGRVLGSVRDDELAARTLGKNAARTKSIALASSAFLAGLAGSLYAYYITFIDPFSFTLLELVPVLAIVVIGGLASLEGTILAAFLVVLLPEPLRFIGFPSSVIGPARQIIFALLLLAVLLYRPKGIGGKVELD